MLIPSGYRDKKNSRPKVDNSHIQNKKQELLNKYLKNIENNKSQNEEIQTKNINDIKNANDSSLEIKQLTAKIKKLEKELKAQKDINKELTTKKSNEQNKLEKYYNIVQECKDTIQEQSSTIKTLNDKINNINQENISIAKELNNAIKRNDILIWHKEKLISEKQNLIKNINELQRLLDKNKKSELALKISELSSIIENYETEVKQLEIKIKHLAFDKELMSNKMVLLERLNDSYKTNATIYKSTKEIDWGTLIKSYIQSYKIGIKYRLNSIINKKYKLYTSLEDKYGNIYYNKLGYNIVFLDGTTRKLDRFSTKKIHDFVVNNDIDGKCCMVSITTENELVLRKVYRSIQSMNNDINRNKTKRTKKKAEIEDTNTNESIYKDIPINILMISAMGKNKYIKSLSSLGLNVDWFDSYEENAKRLDSILSKYDLVFYCIGHSKHYVKDVFKNQSDYEIDKDKYIYLTDDSVANILSIINNFVFNKYDNIAKEDIV